MIFSFKEVQLIIPPDTTTKKKPRELRGFFVLILWDY